MVGLTLVFGSIAPQTPAVALRELGRIERTLFILDWLQSVELRRRVHAGLNKGCLLYTSDAADE